MLPTASENPNGLHQRYQIAKADGTPVDPRGFYFVLRLDGLGDDPIHTAACRAAARVYAEQIREHIPQLADDLNLMLDRLDSGMI